MMRNGHPGNQLPAQDFYKMDVPAAPQRKRRLLPWLLIGSGVLMLALCAGLVAVVAAGGGGSAPATSTSTMPAPAKTGGVAKKAAPPAPATIGDGTFEVGSEVKAGIYTTTAPDSVIGCYWARLRDFDDGLNSIIANDMLTPGAKGRITVKATDAGVKFSGGCRWAKR
jgi:hypothetical protein